MTVAEEQDQFEKEKAEQLVAESPMIDGVRTISVELGDDQTGDPAMWLVFHLQPGLDANSEWIRRFIPYEREIQFKILHSGLKRFPYSRFAEAA